MDASRSQSEPALGGLSSSRSTWTTGWGTRHYLTARAHIDIVNGGQDGYERVSIGGSRNYLDLDVIETEIATYPANTIILTGATYGVDAAVREAAIRHHLELRVYSPRFEGYPTRADAYFARNENIIDDATRLVCFWDGVSTGTAQAIAYARERNLPVSVRSSQVALGEI
jgi:hypothetical protein